MINNSGNKFKYYLELSKFKIMIPVSLTGFTGYFIFNPIFSYQNNPGKFRYLTISHCRLSP